MSDPSACRFCGELPASTVIRLVFAIRIAIYCGNADCKIRPLGAAKLTEAEAIKSWNEQMATPPKRRKKRR